MRVLNLISTIGFFGAEKAMIELSKQLKLSEYEPYLGLVSNSQNSYKDIVKAAKENSLKVEVFPCNSKLDLKTILRIKRYINNIGIDMVHSHGYKSNFYALLATTNMKIGRITTCHNWIANNVKMRFYEYLDKTLLNRFDRVVAVSDVLRDDILKSRITKEKVLVINNGVDVEKFRAAGYTPQFKKSLGLKEDDWVIGTIGRLSTEKGHIYLLKAFVNIILKFPNVKLLIVGDGELKKSLELGVKSLRLENNVIFAGIRNDIPEIFSIMNIFILPSLIEGMPMVLLEAMAAQKPIIATKVGAVPKLIEHNKTGLLIEPKDTEGICASVGLLLIDKEKANSLSLNAFERAKNEFSSSIMAKKYLEVYEEVLKNNKWCN